MSLRAAFTCEKYVTAVRKRLEGHGVPPDRIATVRGYGYRYLPAATPTAGP